MYAHLVAVQVDGHLKVLDCSQQAIGGRCIWVVGGRDETTCDYSAYDNFPLLLPSVCRCTAAARMGIDSLPNDADDAVCAHDNRTSRPGQATKRRAAEKRQGRVRRDSTILWRQDEHGTESGCRPALFLALESTRRRLLNRVPGNPPSPSCCIRHSEINGTGWSS